jgi:hypothetical protein
MGKKKRRAGEGGGEDDVEAAGLRGFGVARGVLSGGHEASSSRGACTWGTAEGGAGGERDARPGARLRGGVRVVVAGPGRVKRMLS